MAAAAVDAIEAAVRVHPHFHGSLLDYAGLAVAALVGWIGVPGAGEAALIAAAVYASRGNLDLTEVLVVAWVSAAAGGMVGWLLGRHGGRAFMTAPGPLRRHRVRALAHGGRFFKRYGVLAVYLAPSWAAGTAVMPFSRFAPANAAAAVIWVLLVGLGAYVAGPHIADALSGVGAAGAVVLIVLAAAGAAAWRRRRRRSHDGSGAT